MSNSNNPSSTIAGSSLSLCPAIGTGRTSPPLLSSANHTRPSLACANVVIPRPTAPASSNALEPRLTIDEEVPDHLRRKVPVVPDRDPSRALAQDQPGFGASPDSSVMIASEAMNLRIG